MKGSAGRKCLFVVAAIALVLPFASVQGMQVGSDALASLRLEFERVPSCKLHVVGEICVAGYDDAGTSDAYADDTVYAYQATKRFALRVNTELLEPTGQEDTLPNRAAVDSRTTTFEHPVFATLGDLAAAFNHARPTPARPFIEARYGQGGTILVLFFSPLTGGTPLPQNAGVPVVYNWWNATDYRHVRPVNNDLVDLTSTDQQLDDRFDGTWASKTCRNAFGIPTETLAPGVCNGLGAVRDAGAHEAKANLPNMVCCADTTGGEVTFKRFHEFPFTPSAIESFVAVQPTVPDSSPATILGPTREREKSDINEFHWVAPPTSGASEPRAMTSDRRVESIVAVPESGLSLIVAGLGALCAFGAAFLYSRLSRENLLDNTNRNRIFEAALANPGITSGEIARQLELNYRTVERHVSKLLTAGMLSSRQDGRKKRLFENHGKYDAREKSLAVLLRTPVAQNLVRALVKREEFQNSLARRLGVPATTLAFHVRRLVAAGTLETRQLGRERMLTVAPAWQGVVADHLDRRGGNLTTRVCTFSLAGEPANSS